MASRAGLLDPLVRTNDDTALTVLRLALGIVMFPHAAQKVFGWFGGPGFSGFVGFVGSHYGVPAGFAMVAVAAELLGSLGLLLGCWAGSPRSASAATCWSRSRSFIATSDSS